MTWLRSSAFALALVLITPPYALLSLCSVSSEHTRELNMKGARAQAKAAHRDKEHEYHKQLHSHDD